MKNIGKTISDYIKNKLNLNLYFDLYPRDDIEGVILVHDPSARKLGEFIDGSAIFQLNISFTARYKNAENCRKNLDAILNLLDGVKLSDSTDDLELKIKSVSNVSFIATDDKNLRYYTSSITVEYKTTSF